MTALVVTAYIVGAISGALAISLGYYFASRKRLTPA